MVQQRNRSKKNNIHDGATAKNEKGLFFFGFLFVPPAILRKCTRRSTHLSSRANICCGCCTLKLRSEKSVSRILESPSCPGASAEFARKEKNIGWRKFSKRQSPPNRIRREKKYAADLCVFSKVEENEREKNRFPFHSSGDFLVVDSYKNKICFFRIFFSFERERAEGGVFGTR